MFFLVFINVFVLSYPGGFAWKTCDNPEQCIVFSSCKPARDLVQLTRKGNDIDNTVEVVGHLRSLQCAPPEFKYDMKICCSEVSPKAFGLNYISDESPVNDTNLNSDQLSITNHQNLGLLPQSCGKVQSNAQVLLGQEQNYPWLVLIKLNRYFWCLGSLINNRYALTSAHCVQNKTITEVRLGDYDIIHISNCKSVTLGGFFIKPCTAQVLNVTEIIIHEGFQANQPKVNDIALVRLGEPANFTKPNIAPICLPTTQGLLQNNLTGSRAKVSDWELNQTHDIEKWYQLPVITDCVMESGKILCDGKCRCNADRGSPLIVKTLNGDQNTLKFIQYGMISHDKEIQSQDRSEYTDITKYMKWILDKIRA